MQVIEMERESEGWTPNDIDQEVQRELLNMMCSIDKEPDDECGHKHARSLATTEALCLWQQGWRRVSENDTFF